MGKKLLKNIIINEVSSVGRGANPGSHVSIMKMDVLNKKSFADIMAEMEIRDDVREMFDEIWDYNSALRESLFSILEDVNGTNKKPRMQESLNQFMNVMTSMVNDSEIIKHIKEGITGVKTEEAEPIYKDFTKDTWSELLEKGSVMTTIRKCFAIQDVSKNQEDEMEKMYKALALMNDAEKEIFKALSKEDQDELLKKETEEVIAEVRKSLPAPVKKEDDEIFLMGDVEVKKSVVGDATFLILKGQQAQIEKADQRAEASEKVAKEEKELRLLKESSDEAESRWPNLPGTAVEKGKILTEIRKLDEDVQKSQLAMLDSGNKSNGALFKESGHGITPESSSAEEALTKMAKAYALETKETFEKAYDAVIQTPEGKDLYEKSLN